MDAKRIEQLKKACGEITKDETVFYEKLKSSDEDFPNGFDDINFVEALCMINFPPYDNVEEQARYMTFYVTHDPAFVLFLFRFFHMATALVRENDLKRIRQTAFFNETGEPVQDPKVKFNFDCIILAARFINTDYNEFLFKAADFGHLLIRFNNILDMVSETLHFRTLVDVSVENTFQLLREYTTCLSKMISPII